MRFMYKRLFAAVIAAVLLCSLLGGCSGGGKPSPLDKDDPVTLHFAVPVGTSYSALRELAKEFSSGDGREKGIIIDIVDADGLEGAALAAERGAEIFVTDAQTAARHASNMDIAPVSEYISSSAVNGFEKSFTEEGRLFGGDVLIYPLMNDSDMTFVNHTDWLEFMKGINGKGYIYVIINNLDDWDGITRVCNTYYRWTDALTPDIPEDGKPFMGFTSAGETVTVLMKQRGYDMIIGEGEEARLNLSASDIKILWDYFYSNYIHGYFAVADDVNEAIKNGDILAYIGSSACAEDFPITSKGNSGEEHDIELFANQYPFYQTGYPYSMSATIGAAVNTKDEKALYAAGVYLEWLTAYGSAMRLAESTAMSPVKKSVVRSDSAEKRIMELAGSEDRQTANTGKILREETQQVIQYDLYSLPAYRGADELVDKFTALLIEECEARRAEAQSRIAAGEDALTVYDELESIDVFEQWYQNMRSEFED